MLVDIKSIIPNTTAQKYINDNGIEIALWIRPMEGYVLHDSNCDIWFDIDGNELTDPMLGFRSTVVTCPTNYDFETNPRGFYTITGDEYEDYLKKEENEENI